MAQAQPARALERADLPAPPVRCASMSSSAHVDQLYLLNHPLWAACVVEHLGDPRQDHRWPLYILDAIGARHGGQAVAPLTSGRRLKLCVFLWVNGVPPDAIASLVGVLAESGLLRDGDAKKNWKSIVNRLVTSELYRRKCFAYDMASGKQYWCSGQEKVPGAARAPQAKVSGGSAVAQGGG